MKKGISELLRLVILKVKNVNFNTVKIQFFGEDVDIDNISIPESFPLARKIMNTLLVTWTMIIKLIHSV